MQQAAQDDIIWDCPSCDSDEAQFHRTGDLAGTAICKECGHQWYWKRKTTRPKDIDTENESTQHQRKKSVSKKHSSQDQTALKDIGGVNSWPTPTPSAGFRTADDESFLRSRQKVQQLRQRVAAKAAPASSSKTKPADESIDDAWPKPALKKTSLKKGVSKKRSIDAQADSGSSESEFEINGSDEDDLDDEELDTVKRKRAKGKQLAVPNRAPQKQTSANKNTHAPDDDDDNESIFSDTGNDIYMSGDEPDEEPEDSLKSINSKTISKGLKKIPKPNTKNKFSMWIMFNKANRHKIAAQHPDANNTELSRLLAAAYRQMSLEEREELRKISAEYRRGVSKIQPPRIIAPRNGYILFSMEISAEILKENPSFRMRDRNVAASRRWKELSEEKRKEYSDRARQMREDFQRRYPEHYQASKERRGTKVAQSLMNFYAEKKRKLNMDIKDELL